MKSNFNRNIIYYIGLIMLLLLTGCGNKQPEKSYVFIYPKIPYLVTYEVNTTLSYKAYNKGDKVCIVDWNNTCIPKDKMIDLYVYIHQLKTSLNKCNSEITNYQEYYKNYNKLRRKNEKTTRQDKD